MHIMLCAMFFVKPEKRGETKNIAMHKEIQGSMRTGQFLARGRKNFSF